MNSVHQKNKSENPSFMKKRILLLILLIQCVLTSDIFSQNFALNTTGSVPDTTAILDISNFAKGLLIPRMTTTQQNAIVLPATSLLIFYFIK